MKRVSLFALVAALASFACAARPDTNTAESADEPAGEAREVDAAYADQADAEAAKAAARSADPRDVGDYVTFSFTGSYRKAPLQLTQRVVDKDAASITIDYVFAEKKGTETLRVKTSSEPGKAGEVLEVAAVAADGSTKLVPAQVFETKMAQTVAVADENEALVSEEAATVKVADAKVEATRAIYKVRVGKTAATLKTLTHASFAWGDLGGEIVTADGKIFYKAELVDAGRSAAATAALSPADPAER